MIAIAGICLMFGAPDAAGFFLLLHWLFKN